MNHSWLASWYVPIGPRLAWVGRFPWCNWSVSPVDPFFSVYLELHGTATFINILIVTLKLRGIHARKLWHHSAKVDVREVFIEEFSPPKFHQPYFLWGRGPRNKLIQKVGPTSQTRPIRPVTHLPLHSNQMLQLQPHMCGQVKIPNYNGGETHQYSL